MATKTISLKLEAYEKLKAARRYAGESFSEVVLRATWPDETVTAQVLLRICRERGPLLTEEMLEESLYVVLSEHYALSIAREKEVIKAVNIGKKDAELLQVKPGMGGFIMFVTGYLEGGSPLWSAQVLYRGDCYELHNEYSAKGTVSPVKGVWLEVKEE